MPYNYLMVLVVNFGVAGMPITPAGAILLFFFSKKDEVALRKEELEKLKKIQTGFVGLLP
ncbi:MAG: hypothetical protein NTV01_02630 [Bacteroidia bacterium]|nr:hypothetical protein [Bacteroidia bacterium]